MQFAMQITPVSTNIEPRTETKNQNLGKTVLKMWSLIEQKTT